ncbi:IS66 family transposase [Kordia sp.]|uniref:IS66 family transposase n=1 Tax=Kordia sp. TaxID=1965332 RepID=UPI003D26D5AC
MKNASDTTEETAYISKKEYDDLLDKYRDVAGQLAELKRLIFGSKSERFVSTALLGQLGLFGEASQESSSSAEKQVLRQTKVKIKPKKVAKRAILPAHLPRVEEIIEPKNLTQDSVKIGEEVTEILEYNPAKLFVRRIVRPKYALKDYAGVIIGELPSLPLPKSNAGAGLLAHILVSKFVDHLPFYRQRQIFKRQQYQVSDATLSGWFNAATSLLEPLYDVLTKELLQSNYLQVDESPIGVQDSYKTGSLHTGYHWVYHAPVEGLVLFKYDATRSIKAPQTILKNYKGTLQSDGYKVYQNLATAQQLKLLSCMAHARRYFEKALDNDHSRASYAMEQFQKLYGLEANIREHNATSKVIKRYRNRYAKPILDTFYDWLVQQRSQLLPKSSIAKAVGYTLRLWKYLIGYLEDGKYLIDNNKIENTIRPLALGRKNYLFAGSHKAAQKAAMMYSFFATCKINNVEPFAWLHDIFKKIPEHKANKLHELLPQNWKNNSIENC